MRDTESTSLRKMCIYKPRGYPKVLARGVLPKCCEGVGIDVEVQEQAEGVISCFVRNDDDTVICPMGQTLFKLRMRGGRTHGEGAAKARPIPKNLRMSENNMKRAISMMIGIEALIAEM